MTASADKPEPGRTPVEVTVTSGGGRTRVVVVGDLDVATAVQLDLATVELETSDAVDLDLGAVTFLDSSGVSAIVRLGDRVGGISRVRISSASPRAARVLDLCGLAVRTDAAVAPDDHEGSSGSLG